jgi:hypothetical protein
LIFELVFPQNISVSGIVRDKSEKKEPLAFVNILTESGNGATTDIDGKFQITVKKGSCCLHLSYVGFEALVYEIDFANEKQIIYLTPKIFDLSEVEVFPGINPADRIIENAVKNRNLNDPEKLSAFTYTSYDKMVVTSNIDSLTVLNTEVMDSMQRTIYKLIKKQDFFMMETVTERKYMSPGLNQENVLATKVSGFKDPMAAFMISQVQSTSFYSDFIRILGSNYVNPITRGSTKKYFFTLEDTTYSPTGDSIFIISFRPMKNTNFEGLKGFLYINSNRWAIQNVKAAPQNDTSGIIIKIQQAYDFIQGHWFPTQLNTDITFLNASFRVGDTSYYLIGKGRSYIKDINLSPDLKKSDFSFYEVEIEPDAAKKKGEFWRDYRVDSLTEREKETYRVIDSLGKEANFDKIANTFQTVVTGRIPWGPIDFDLNRFAHYNNYEGFYLGLGLHTNERFSKKLKLGGFWGYGFKDKSAKYGLDASVLVHKASESSIRIDGYNQLIATGSTEFFDDKDQIWRPDDFYKFFISMMNPTIGGELNFSFKLKPMRSFKWNIGLRAQQKESYGNYYFTNGPETADNQQTTFNFTDLLAGFRFSFREKVFQTTKGEISFGSNFPIVWLNYTYGINGFLNGDFTYNRFDLKIEDNFMIKYLGELSVRLTGGLVLGNVPITNLYNSRASYRVFTVYAPNSFGTMRVNEFFSNRYVALFLSHNFKNLLIDFKGKFKPELMLLTNITFGAMDNKQNQHNIDYNTLEKGYYESGFAIRKLLNLQIYDLGVSILYRYGPYSFDNISLNFAYKISLFYGF